MVCLNVHFSTGSYTAAVIRWLSVLTLLLAACSETSGIALELGVRVDAGGGDEKLKVGSLKLLIGRETAGRLGTSATWSINITQLTSVSELKSWFKQLFK